MKRYSPRTSTGTRLQTSIGIVQSWSITRERHVSVGISQEVKASMSHFVDYMIYLRISIEYIVHKDEEVMEKRQTRDYTGKRKLESGPA